MTYKSKAAKCSGNDNKDIAAKQSDQSVQDEKSSVSPSKSGHLSNVGQLNKMPQKHWRLQLPQYNYSSQPYSFVGDQTFFRILTNAKANFNAANRCDLEYRSCKGYDPNAELDFMTFHIGADSPKFKPTETGSFNKSVFRSQSVSTLPRAPQGLNTGPKDCSDNKISDFAMVPVMQQRTASDSLPEADSLNRTITNVNSRSIESNVTNIRNGQPELEFSFSEENGLDALKREGSSLKNCQLEEVHFEPNSSVNDNFKTPECDSDFKADGQCIRFGSCTNFYSEVGVNEFILKGDMPDRRAAANFNFQNENQSIRPDVPNPVVNNTIDDSGYISSRCGAPVRGSSVKGIRFGNSALLSRGIELSADTRLKNVLNTKAIGARRSGLDQSPFGYKYKANKQVKGLRCGDIYRETVLVKGGHKGPTCTPRDLMPSGIREKSIEQIKKNFQGFPTDAKRAIQPTPHRDRCLAKSDLGSSLEQSNISLQSNSQLQKSSRGVIRPMKSTAFKPDASVSHARGTFTNKDLKPDVTFTNSKKGNDLHLNYASIRRLAFNNSDELAILNRGGLRYERKPVKSKSVIGEKSANTAYSKQAIRRVDSSVLNNSKLKVPDVFNSIKINTSSHDAVDCEF